MRARKDAWDRVLSCSGSCSGAWFHWPLRDGGSSTQRPTAAALTFVREPWTGPRSSDGRQLATRAQSLTPSIHRASTSGSLLRLSRAPVAAAGLARLSPALRGFSTEPDEDPAPATDLFSDEEDLAPSSSLASEWGHFGPPARPARVRAAIGKEVGPRGARRRTQVFTLEAGRVADYADGSCIVTDATGSSCLGAVVMGLRPVPFSSTPPLSIELRLRAGAFGKGFMRTNSLDIRQGSLQSYAARGLLRQALLPLLPAGLLFPVTVSVQPIAVAPECDLEVLMINAAAAALFASDVPVIAPAAAVRVAKLEGSAWSVCPDVGQLEKAKLSMLYFGTADGCLYADVTGWGMKTPHLAKAAEVAQGEAASLAASIAELAGKTSITRRSMWLYGADATAAGVVRALAWPTINRMLGLPLPPETFRDVSMKNFSVFDAQRRSEVYHAVTQPAFMEHGESISDKLLGPSTRMPGSVWKDAAKAAGAVESAGEQGSGGAGTTAKEPEPAGRGGGLAALEDGRRIRRVLQALEVSIMDRLRILGRMRAAMGRIPGSGGVSPTDVSHGVAATVREQVLRGMLQLGMRPGGVRLDSFSKHAATGVQQSGSNPHGYAVVKTPAGRVSAMATVSKERFEWEPDTVLPENFPVAAVAAPNLMCLLRVPGFATGDTFGSSGVGDMEILTGLFVRNALAHALSTGAAKASGAEANGDAGQSQPGAPSRPLAVFSARVQLEALTGGAQSVVAAAVSAASVALADAGMTSAHVGGGCAAVFTAASPLGPTEVDIQPVPASSGVSLPVGGLDWVLRHPLSKRSTDQADMQAVDQAVDHTGSQRDGRAGDQVDSQADSRANLSEGRGGSRDRRSRGGVSDAVGYGPHALIRDPSGLELSHADAIATAAVEANSDDVPPELQWAITAARVVVPRAGAPAVPADVLEPLLRTAVTDARWRARSEQARVASLQSKAILAESASEVGIAGKAKSKGDPDSRGKAASRSEAGVAAADLGQAILAEGEGSPHIEASASRGRVFTLPQGTRPAPGPDGEGKGAVPERRGRGSPWDEVEAKTGCLVMPSGQKSWVVYAPNEEAQRKLLSLVDMSSVRRARAEAGGERGEVGEREGAWGDRGGEGGRAAEWRTGWGVPAAEGWERMGLAASRDAVGGNGATVTAGVSKAARGGDAREAAGGRKRKAGGGKAAAGDAEKGAAGGKSEVAGGKRGRAGGKKGVARAGAGAGRGSGDGGGVERPNGEDLRPSVKVWVREDSPDTADEGRLLSGFRAWPAQTTLDGTWTVSRGAQGRPEPARTANDEEQRSAGEAAAPSDAAMHGAALGTGPADDPGLNRGAAGVAQEGAPVAGLGPGSEGAGSGAGSAPPAAPGLFEEGRVYTARVARVGRRGVFVHVEGVSRVGVTLIPSFPSRPPSSTGSQAVDEGVDVGHAIAVVGVRKKGNVVLRHHGPGAADGVGPASGPTVPPKAGLEEPARPSSDKSVEPSGGKSVEPSGGKSVESSEGAPTQAVVEAAAKPSGGSKRKRKGAKKGASDSGGGSDGNGVSEGATGAKEQRGGAEGGAEGGATDGVEAKGGAKGKKGPAGKAEGVESVAAGKGTGEGGKAVGGEGKEEEGTKCDAADGARASDAAEGSSGRAKASPKRRSKSTLSVESLRGRWMVQESWFSQ